MSRPVLWQRNQKRHYLIISAVEWYSFELFINICYRAFLIITQRFIAAILGCDSPERFLLTMLLSDSPVSSPPVGRSSEMYGAFGGDYSS